MPALSLLPRLDTRSLDAFRFSHHTLNSLLRRYLIPRRILPRDGAVVLAIPTQYEGINAGPSPGVVTAIILGSIAGFLLILWLLWMVSHRRSGFIRSSSLREEEVMVRRRSQSRATKRSRQTEMASKSPVRRERVIRQERIVRDRDIPAPRGSSRLRETVMVDDMDIPPPQRRVQGDDVVEVIEEHSSVGPPPRRHSRRGSSAGYRRGDYSDDF